MNRLTPTIVVLATAAIMLFCGNCALSAVVFNNIDPRPIQTNSIDPHRMRNDPYHTMAVPSKVSAPMPGFQQNQILPDRIRMTPINMSDMTRSHIRPDRLHFTNISKADILPQKMNAKPLVQPFSPGQRMAMPIKPPAPQFGFNPEMESATKPSIFFDSSIRLNMNRQSMPAPPSPMGW